MYLAILITIQNCHHPILYLDSWSVSWLSMQPALGHKARYQMKQYTVTTLHHNKELMLACAFQVLMSVCLPHFAFPFIFDCMVIFLFMQ